MTKLYRTIIAALAGLLLAPFANAQQPFDPNYGGIASAQFLGGPESGVAYWEEGEGTPVVFFYPAFATWWQSPMKDLSSGYNTIALGIDPARMPPDDLTDPTPLIEALEALGDTLGRDRFILVTHSISGRMAMELAISRPDLLAGLVFEEPAWSPTPDMQGDLAPPPEPSCDLDLDHPAEQALCDFMSVQMGPGRFEVLSEPVRQFLFMGPRQQAEASAQAARARGEEPQPPAPPEPLQLDVICDDLGQLDLPILFVRGEDTPAFFSAGMDYYEGCLPQHETAVVPNATHMVHFENPDAYNAALRSFLSSLDE